MTDAQDHVLISIALHKDDVAKLLAAFQQGRLADLNIVDVMLPSDESRQETVGKWTKSENTKIADRDVPPRQS